jgi:GTP-binding protein HflX
MSAATRPVQLNDHFTVDGQSVPRFFVSAQTGEGLAALREFLAQEAVVNLPDDHVIAQGMP